MGGAGGGGMTGDHLVFSEIAVAPDTGEFVEIYNPTAAAVDLSNYYLSDNSTYVDLASGKPWQPITNNPGTDFLARFPAGTSIGAGKTLVVGFDPGYEMTYNGCPDFFVGTAPVACGGKMIPILLATEMSSVADTSNLSNAREMLVLFTWDGDKAHTLKDVDYVTWGAMFDDGSRADKTGVMGYQPDTVRANQKPATAPTVGQSIERCVIESAETAMGGNGITGHDEMSEDLGAAFMIQAKPTPGVKNACLP
jgi:hypothetical protein